MADDPVEQIAARLVAVSIRVHPARDARVGMRSGMLDAAALCDALAKVIENEHRGRGGKVRKRGVELAAIAKRCGDAIEKMRDGVDVTRS
jgi:uncharacterized membrane protein